MMFQEEPNLLPAEKEDKSYSQHIFEGQVLPKLFNINTDDITEEFKFFNRFAGELQVDRDPKLYWLIKAMIFSCNNQAAINALAVCSLMHAYKVLFTSNGEVRPSVMNFLTQGEEKTPFSKYYINDKTGENKNKNKIKRMLLSTYANYPSFLVSSPDQVDSIMGASFKDLESEISFVIVAKQVTNRFSKAINEMMGDEDISLEGIIGFFPGLIKDNVIPFLMDHSKVFPIYDINIQGFIDVIKATMTDNEADMAILGSTGDGRYQDLSQQFSRVLEQSKIQLQAAFPEIMVGMIDLFKNINLSFDQLGANMLNNLTFLQKEIVTFGDDSPKDKRFDYYKAFLQCIEMIKLSFGEQGEKLIQQMVDNSNYGKFDARARAKLALDTKSSTLAKRALRRPSSFGFFSHDRDAVSNAIASKQLTDFLIKFAHDKSVYNLILESDYYVKKIIYGVRLLTPEEWKVTFHLLIDGMNTYPDFNKAIEKHHKLSTFFQQMKHKLVVSEAVRADKNQAGPQTVQDDKEEANSATIKPTIKVGGP